jgi:hypothetical protein
MSWLIAGGQKSVCREEGITRRGEVMKSRDTFLISVVLVLFGLGHVQAESWTALNMPGAKSTFITGVSGNNIVGYYWDASYNTHGCLYNGTTWTTLDKPGSDYTEIYGVDGSNLVGSAGNHGFRYNGTTWTTIDKPGAWTSINDISGNKLVGSYYDGSYTHGFLYNGTTWTTLDMPWTTQLDTEIRSISGNNMVGEYWGETGYQGFLYDGKTWTTLSMPGADLIQVNGIDRSNIVGGAGSHGFLYNGSGWITLDMPGAWWTEIYSIDGSNLVGQYGDYLGTHGFIYTIPEPATLLLFAFGGLALRRKR